MNDEQLKLKIRLKVKKLNKILKKDADLNFGYTSSYVDSELSERDKLLEIARKKFPELYIELIDQF
jgi:hypothetical protein